MLNCRRKRRNKRQMKIRNWRNFRQKKEKNWHNYKLWLDDYELVKPKRKVMM